MACYSHNVVIIGKAPHFDDVLYKSGMEPPFNLESFEVYAKLNHFDENIAFWRAVEAFKATDTSTVSATTYVDSIKQILETYVMEKASAQVNLSARERQATETAAKQAIAAACHANGDSGVSMDLSIFDCAQDAIKTMVERDQYSTYVEEMVLEKRINLAKSEALWWLHVDKVSLDKFFTFPSPINDAESRCHNVLTALIIIVANLLAYFADFPYLFIYLLYGFVARTLCGPRLDPQALLVLFVVRPLAVDKLGLLKNKFVPSPPKRFSQAVGAFFSMLCLVFALVELWIALWVVSAMFLGAALLAGLCDECLACHMFTLMANKGILPANMCADCKLNYVDAQSDSPLRLKVSKARAYEFDPVAAKDSSAAGADPSALEAGTPDGST
eukprot:TRINITY_DN7217_c0_g1_i1.p1 TRINITY_DN7217_c0_g1~~TRINITY_DN7217_c0_g1_i1.p1  ORF type:complete len:404 (-),score=93.26 TRINITY_DN7217_c0_g1_i1:350-1510(-)